MKLYFRLINALFLPSFQFSILVVDEILPVMVLDALLTSHAVSSRIENTDQIIQYFDNISYNKVYFKKLIFYNVDCTKKYLKTLMIGKSDRLGNTFSS